MTDQIPQEAMELAKSAEIFAGTFSGFKIEFADAMIVAGEKLRDIKTKIALIEDTRKSITKPIDDAKSRVMDFFRRPVLLLQEAENNIKKAMLVFQQQEELKRQEAERLARELARKEEERQRKLFEKKAEVAAAKGNEEKAAELQQKAAEVYVPVPVLAKEPVKIEGISTKNVWTYEITNADIIPRPYLMPDEKRIGAMVKASNGTLAIPGIRIYQEQIIVARRS